MSVPIVLLHHNEFDYLLRTLISLKKNTFITYQIIIVDNNSNPNQIFWNDLVKQFSDLIVIFNKRNNWVYGFNLAKKYLKNHDYFILSDADIEFPNPVNNICWLAYLIQQLKQYSSIGKAGLPLDLSNIQNHAKLVNLYKRELTFKTGQLIGTNIVAPVDTTVAIYRNDLFMESFHMRVGHFSNIKPKYYCVRVDERYKCKHIGWEKYVSTQDEINNSQIIKKANFFGRYAIMMEQDLLNKISIFYRCKYYFLFYIFKAYYSVRIFINLFIYFISLNVIKDNKKKYIK